MQIIVTEKLKKRFLAKVKKTRTCWIWVAAKNSYGYGQIKVNYKSIGAHRVSYILHRHKSIPAGKLICHTCDNRQCVNPKHLYVGTEYTNAQDCVRKGRQTRLRGVNNGHAILTDLDVVEIRNSILPSYKIAPLYGVVPSTIRSVRNRSRWGHLK